MSAGRSVAAGMSLVLVAGLAWWTMSGLDVGPDVSADPSRTAAGVEASAPAPSPDAMPRPPVQLTLPTATPRTPPGPPDALTGADQDAIQAATPNPKDDAHFQAVAEASMAAKLSAISAQFSTAAGGLQGVEREDVKRVLDDAYGEMRDVADQLKHREIDIGTAFGEVERIRDRVGREVDATLPADRAPGVKAAAGVRSPEEAASAVDWGIPLDEATTDEVFKEP